MATRSFALTYERKRCLHVKRLVELHKFVVVIAETQNLTSSARHGGF